jgi:hypothetical protein
MKPKNQLFQISVLFFFNGANVPQLTCPGNTHTQAHFSDSSRLFEDHLRLLPGIVPSNLIQIPPCVSKSPLPYFCHTLHLDQISSLDASGPTVLQKAHRLPPRFQHNHHPLSHSPPPLQLPPLSNFHCNASPHQHPGRHPEARWSYF